jgi:L-seryl-tRNA(Ser) seleniumtransferase
MQRLPKLDGLKNEVVMPRTSRNVYDHAIRMTGVTMITPNTREEFLAALGPRTAMIALLGEEKHPLPLKEMAEAAHQRGIPILVDAAAETVDHSQHLSDCRGRHGGLQRRQVLAWSAVRRRAAREKRFAASGLDQQRPHHAFGRSLKVGKEEIMGMLAAVEAWTHRNHDAEWKQWRGGSRRSARRSAGFPRFGRRCSSRAVLRTTRRSCA